MIQRLETPELARAWCAEERGLGRSLGFVPTMGALHEGHLGLVRRAREENDRVCVSVFVNPLQFNEPADFERYRRDFEGDADLLGASGCDMAFTGTLAQFFPESDGTLEGVEREDPGPSAAGLEGTYRPGHFDGVATIVRRLFEVVRPDRGYFGQKDFQQALVVSDIARRLGYPEVVVCPTSREDSGLARSSRNEQLSDQERDQAVSIHAALTAARELWGTGERRPAELAAAMGRVLELSPLQVEYAEVRDPEHWTGTAPTEALERAVALVAAKLGPVRLIDNLRLDDEVL